MFHNVLSIKTKPLCKTSYSVSHLVYIPNLFRRKGGKRDEEKKLEVVCRIAPYRGTNPCVIALDDQTVRFVPPEGLMRRNGEAYVGFWMVIARMNAHF